MISLDTHILVCIFIVDAGQPEQSKKARQIVSEYKAAYVSQVVQVETV